ncbi:hypothetical protein GVAV_000862 [Gurleya vavrai]
MQFLKEIPPATRTILFLSIVFPLIAYLNPKSIKYLYYDISFLPFQFYRLFTGLFLTTFSLSFVLNLMTRYNILKNIEQNNLLNINTKYEILFFTFLFPVMFFVANFVEKLTTFNECINIAFIKLLCDTLPQNTTIPFYGLMIDTGYFPYVYLAIDLVISKMQSKSYYGFAFASVYTHMKKNNVKVPVLFIKSVDFIEKKVIDIFRILKTGKLVSKGQARTGRRMVMTINDLNKKNE